MREILTFVNGKIRKRVIAFDVNSTERQDQLFLSFSEGREHGPIIERTGNDSPRMRSPDGSGYTTDPELQRLGSWFVSERMKRRSIVRNFAVLAHLYNRLGDKARTYLDALPVADSGATFLLLNEGKLNGLAGHLVKIAAKLELDSSDRRLKNKCNSNDWSDALSFLRTLVDQAQIEDGDIGSTFDLYQSTKIIDSMLDEDRAAQERELGPRIGEEVKKLCLRLLWSLKTPVHESRFQYEHPDVKISAVQGCGDLSMNGWNVAFVARPEGGPLFVFPYDEPVEERTYTCLVKWKLEALKDTAFVTWKGNEFQYEIGEVEINRYSDPPDIHLVISGQQVHDSHRERRWPIVNLAEFVVYGQRIVQDRCCVDMQSTIRQFSDLRHILEFPNLNPNKPFLSKCDPNTNHPRTIFSRRQFDDVWLGEYALLQDRNLQRAALAGPIQLDLASLGTTSEHIEAALEGTDQLKQVRHYRQVEDRLKPLKQGEWRKIVEGRETWYEIFFRRNVYPCSIIGISETGELISHVWKGVYSDPTGMTIEEAAQHLTGGDFRVKEALLIDEGADVFQVTKCEDKARSDFGLEPGRSQVRAMFFFGTSAEVTVTSAKR